MDFTLKRTNYSQYGIFGKLICAGGTLNLVTLEHAFKTPECDAYFAAIAPGIYKCIRYASPDHGYDVFWLQNVPGHTYCEIHIGNFQADSDGCILVGEYTASINGGPAQMITNSKDAFAAFMVAQKGVDQFQLTISG